MSIDTAIAAIMSATSPDVVKPQAPPARFFLVVPDSANVASLQASIASQLAPLHATVQPITASAPRDLVITIPGRTFVPPASAAFAAAHALEDALGIAPIEAEVIHAVMPIDTGAAERDLESVDNFPPGCWVAAETPIDNDKAWAVARLRLTDAWALSEQMGRPSRGAGVVICQIDTGVTDHPELAGVARAGSFNVIGDGHTPEDPTDPLNYQGNPGHGTGTASVAVSPETLEVVGAAPRARHLPIRAIDTVVRLSQTNVAAAMDRAVEMGAHVISMSLGGIWSFALQRALERAIAADVIVVAAAGNCVDLVVWPARFDDCIAVAGTDYHDKPWIGSCRGPAVAISAPAQNVYRALPKTGKSGQGQGTSFAVALVAGVAACWVAHHGRANIAAEARRRGESIQALFKRLLRASAHRPAADWDAFNMGSGIVDARRLMEIGFDAGIGMEAQRPLNLARRGDESLRQFAVEAFGPHAATADIDWLHVGAETSLAEFQRRLYRAPRPGGLESAGGPAPISLPASVVQALAQAQQPATPAAGAAPPAGAVPSPAIRVAPGPATAPPDRRLVALKRIIAARHAAAHSGLESAATLHLESTLPPDAALPSADDILHRVSQVVETMPVREMGDPVAFRQALEIMYRHGPDAIGKLPELERRPQHFSSHERVALEAIIIADGSRPSFLLEKGFPPQTHPFMGIWTRTLTDLRTQIANVAQCVGRVQPTNGNASCYIGTATLVDAANGLALTNYHVVDDARNTFFIPMSQSGDRLRVPAGLEVDFAAEACSLDQNRFKVTEVILPAGYGRGFGSLDAAVLKLEPVDATSKLPPAPAVLNASPAFASGGVQSLVVIGFPGPAPTTEAATFDWGFVTNALFGNLFGFKRLAPGRFYRSLGFSTDDTLRSVFGHDATTFAGSSGSFVLAWTNPDLPCFGLHFQGVTSDTNSAIAIAVAADALRRAGVPVA